MPYIIEMIEVVVPHKLPAYKEVRYVFKTVSVKAKSTKDYKTTKDILFAKRYKCKFYAQHVVDTRYPITGRVVPV